MAEGRFTQNLPPFLSAAKNQVYGMNIVGLRRADFSAADRDEIKRAFRQQIARYHPDKVEHLGKEFQEMAAHRAAELTEAYRVLSNDSQRAEYDRALAATGSR